MPFWLRVGEIARGTYGVGRDGRYIVARYPAANPNVAKASSAPSTVCHANQGLARQVSAGVMMWWRQEATRGGDGDWAGSLGPRLVPWTSLAHSLPGYRFVGGRFGDGGERVAIAVFPASTGRGVLQDTTLGTAQSVLW